MQIQSQVLLKDFSTMRLGGPAKALTTVRSKQELVQAADWAKRHNLPILVLGGGSNVIFSDGYNGLVIINKIPGFEVIKDSPDSTLIRIGAGENWDNAVAKSVKMGLHGLEMLSAIPGTAGATPVQNVGAYGAEIADTFVELEALDTNNHEFVTLNKEACNFSYRNSIFKPPKNRHYIIASITVRLSKQPPKPPFYASLQKYLDEHSITNFTPQTIRDAVVAIRAVKLPDPAKIANTGSFFKNPVIDEKKAEALVQKFPDMPHWAMPDGRVKLAAGWLIDRAGLRGYAAHGMKTYEHHALVLVNDSASSYADLLAFKNEIIAKVESLFGVTLQQEPELL